MKATAITIIGTVFLCLFTGSPLPWNWYPTFGGELTSGLVVGMLIFAGWLSFLLDVVVDPTKH